MSTADLRPLLPPDWQLDEKPAFLADMREAVQHGPYQGYPPSRDRLFMDRVEYTADGRPIFPFDPGAAYTVFNHSTPGEARPASAFFDTGNNLTFAEAQRIVWGDMDQDFRGFPRHRFAVDMVTDLTIGGIIGPGCYWQPGKKWTADMGLIGELARDAAVREVTEEARYCPAPALVKSLGKRIVADPRLTTCTEAETELFVADTGRIPLQKPDGGSDAKWAGWIIADHNVLRPGLFFGSHRRMLLEVVAWYQAQREVTVMQNGLVVPNS